MKFVLNIQHNIERLEDLKVKIFRGDKMSIQTYYILMGVGLVAQLILFIGYINEVDADDADD